MGLLVPANVAAARVEQIRSGRGVVPQALTSHALMESDLFWTTEATIEQARNVGVFPQPRGHKVAVMLIKPPKQLGSIHILDDYVERKTAASTTGVVLAIGPNAYQDTERFPHGPDCQIGEVVLIPKYSGQAIKLPGQNGEIFTITFINDDEITAGWGDTVISFAEAGPEEPRAPVAADMAASVAADAA